MPFLKDIQVFICSFKQTYLGKEGNALKMLSTVSLRICIRSRMLLSASEVLSHVAAFTCKQIECSMFEGECETSEL